jgi:hypothetical protein
MRREERGQILSPPGCRPALTSRLTGLRPRSPDTFFNVVCAEEPGLDESQTELAIKALVGHCHHPGQAEILCDVEELD